MRVAPSAAVAVLVRARIRNRTETPSLVNESALTRIREQGMSILVVDKSLRELTAVADRCVILERGATVWSGASDALSPDLTARYLGV